LLRQALLEALPFGERRGRITSVGAMRPFSRAFGLPSFNLGAYPPEQLARSQVQLHAQRVPPHPARTASWVSSRSGPVPPARRSPWSCGAWSKAAAYSRWTLVTASLVRSVARRSVARFSGTHVVTAELVLSDLSAAVALVRAAL
jgi:hypothetical protein